MGRLALALAALSTLAASPAHARPWVRVRVWRPGFGWGYVLVAPPPPPPAPAVVYPAAAPVVAAPIVAAPVVAAPVYEEQLPPPPPPPLAPPAPVALRMAPPPPTVRVGLGLTGTGFHFGDTQLGGGVGHLRLRSTDHLTIEFAAGVMGGRDSLGITRRDVPTTVGLYLYPWHCVVAPYFVAAGGANFVHIADADQRIDGTQLVGALGGGLEFRLGPHLALGADLRYQWRSRIDQPAQPTASVSAIQASGSTGNLPPLGDEKGPAFNISATFYF
jgi:hypothetical protein